MMETPTQDQIKAFVIAGHGNLEVVKAMLKDEPGLLNAAFEWQPGDFETALQGASHLGNRAIATYLLQQGAPLEITSAAMLGRRDEIETMLNTNPLLIHNSGAHGITLLTHAALSGDASLVADLYNRGATTGADMALNLAVACEHLEVTKFLLDHANPDLHWKNFKGNTALELAQQSGHAELIALLEGKQP
jgi:uncharacterized protein